MKVLEEKNGFKLGINENPDVAHLPEEDRYQIETPSGSIYSGGEKGIRKKFELMTE